MYRLVLTVVQVMDLYDIHASLWEAPDDGGPNLEVAMNHMTVAGDPWGNADPFSSIISAIREWSDRAISS
jgi:hypothetical protein